MILDRENLFTPLAGANAFGGVGVNVIAPDQIDLRQRRDVATGEPWLVFVQVTTAFVGAGSSTTFEIVVASNVALTADVEVIGASQPIPLAELGLGRRFTIASAPADLTLIGQRYLGFRSRASGAATTAGAIVAGVILNDDLGARKLPGYPAVQPFV